MNKFRKQHAIVACLTPAALLAACNSTGGWAWDRPATGRSPDYASMGDSADRARIERDSADDDRYGNQNDSRYGNQYDNRNDNRYDNRNNNRSNRYDSDPNRYDAARSDGSRPYADGTGSNNTGAYDSRGNPVARSDGSRMSGDRTQTTNDSGYDRSSNRTDDRSGAQYNSWDDRNDRNWTKQEQLAANREIADPATNPSNANAQYGQTDVGYRDTTRRDDRWMTTRGDSVSGMQASPETRILSILHHKNQEEIELGRLAASRGRSESVRRYGDMMVREHADADRKVMSVASSINASLLSRAETKRLIEREHDGMSGSGTWRSTDQSDPYTRDSNRDAWQNNSNLGNQSNQNQSNQNQSNQWGQPSQTNQSTPTSGSNQNAGSPYAQNSGNQYSNQNNSAQPHQNDTSKNTGTRSSNQNNDTTWRDQSGRDQTWRDQNARSNDRHPQDPVEMLRSKSGEEFDQAFAQKMVEGHGKLIAMIENAQSSISDNQVRTLLMELLPTVRMHEQMARELSSGNWNEQRMNDQRMNHTPGSMNAPTNTNSTNNSNSPNTNPTNPTNPNNTNNANPGNTPGTAPGKEPAPK